MWDEVGIEAMNFYGGEVTIDVAKLFQHRQLDTKWIFKMVGVSKKLDPKFAKFLFPKRKITEKRIESCLSYHPLPEMNGGK
ncbi:hypothetical protein ID856_15705 [Xenorhabdus sp. 18]|uniref:hypothetical protein n=1 Tax=Xenorhabdus doucetiae TaxID=351671 RepID=UPI0019ADA9B4|nr:hypothetical protein [Xenorhabdus sp. 18]MBD2797964.1 hypothetical protein [Xenorhabdus sp. 18]